MTHEIRQVACRLERKRRKNLKLKTVHRFRHVLHDAVVRVLRRVRFVYFSDAE